MPLPHKTLKEIEVNNKKQVEENRKLEGSFVVRDYDGYFPFRRYKSTTYWRKISPKDAIRQKTLEEAKDFVDSINSAWREGIEICKIDSLGRARKINIRGDYHGFLASKLDMKPVKKHSLTEILK